MLSIMLSAMPSITIQKPRLLLKRCRSILRRMLWNACGLLLLIHSPWSLSSNFCETNQHNNTDTSQIILLCEQQINETARNDPAYIELSLSLARMYQSTGDLNSAERILKSVIDESTDISLADKITSLRQLGIIYFSQRLYEQSYNSFEQALTAAIKTEDKAVIALGYNDLANVYHAYGDFDTASKLLLKSYDLHAQVNNDIGRASTLNNLGTLYKDQGAFDEAIVALRRSYSIYTSIDNPLRAALTLANLGDTFHQNGDSEKAIELLTQSATELQQLNSYQSLAKVYILLAEVSVKTNNSKAAQRFLDEAKLTASLVQASAENPKHWYVQGLIWNAQNELAKAGEAYEKAFQLIKQNNEFKFQEQLYEAMAKLSERKNDFEASSRYWHIYASTLENQRSLKNSIRSHHIRSVFSFSSDAGSEEKMNIQLLFALLSAGLSLLILAFFAKFKPLRRFKTASVQKNQGKKYPQLASTSEHSGVAQTSSVPMESYHTSRETHASDSFEHDATFDHSFNENSDPQNGEFNHFRQQLVELMHLAVQIWEEQTQSGKLELAEKSKIWSVGIDDGRLRARAMERYFSINTLPQKPRWRSVVRTCNYVLRHCNAKSLYREELEVNLKTFQANIKRNATIVIKNVA